MHKEIRNMVILIGICISALSCKRQLEAKEYIKHVSNKENGLVKTICINEFEFAIQYRPSDYIVLLENLNAEESVKRRATLSGTAFFLISLKLKGKNTSPLRYKINGLDDYNVRLNYYLNEAKNDIWLNYDGKKILPMSYLYENNYNLTPFETIIVGFSLPDGILQPKNDMQFSFNDRVFDNGIIKTTFSRDALNKIPGLIYKN